MAKVKTRLQVLTHLHHLVGQGRELPVAELPTCRDLIRYGLYLRELSDQDRRNYNNDQLVADLMESLLVRWCSANPKFIEPVINSQVRIKTKLKSLWDQANKVSLGRAKLEEKDRFTEKLDKLMDILNCKCEIKTCTEVSCSSACLNGVHIFCDCSKDKKIPVIELAFIKGQREKVGSVGPHQIGPVDLPETRRQAEQKERQKQKKQSEEKRRKKYEKEHEEVMQQCMLESGEESEKQAGELEQEESSDNSSDNVSANTKRAKYNTEDITNIALASLRHHTGLRETAEIATAAWIDAGLITQLDTVLVIDHNKVRRAQERIMKELEAKFAVELQENGISCIFF